MSARFELDGLRPVRPPAELRKRVLAAARAAELEQPSWIDRVWESRRLRLAAAAAWLTVLAIHAADRPSRWDAARSIAIDGLVVPLRSEPSMPSDPHVAELLEEIGAPPRDGSEASRRQ